VQARLDPHHRAQRVGDGVDLIDPTASKNAGTGAAGRTCRARSHGKACISKNLESEQFEEIHMTIAPLAWSAWPATGWTGTEAKDHLGSWRVTPVPGDVARIYFTGRDASGLIVSSTTNPAYAENETEAKMLVEAMRADQAALPAWDEQLKTAGFVRTFSENLDGGRYEIWRDNRESGLYQIVVKDRHVDTDGYVETSVHTTYEADGSSSWHNVVMVDGSSPTLHCVGECRYRDGLPETVDALKSGVAATIAIRDARNASGVRFATPLGGATRKRG
jgi:hypothetical protein